MKSVTLLIVVFCVSNIKGGDDDHDQGGDDDHDQSYSYHKFRGPVSGRIRQIVVPGYPHDRYQRVDFVAKPDYKYAYGVQDPKTGNSQTHQETRDGDAVNGEYRVLQADGLVRIVKYTAGGEHGFKAVVTYEKA